MSRPSLPDWAKQGFMRGRASLAEGSASARRRRSLGLELEGLERRIVLSANPRNSIKADTTAELIQAIDTENRTGGGTIVLKDKTYEVTKANNYWYGPNGFPAISSNITILGQGAKITRSNGDFRFFYVSSRRYGGQRDGTLTLEGLTLEKGLAKGGESYYGGGGLGAGGAIFNQGTLVLEGVLLLSNEARGGGSGYNTSSVAGAGIGPNVQSNAQAPGGFGGSVPGFEKGGPTREGQGGSATMPAGFGGGGVSTSVGGFGGGGGTNYKTGRGSPGLAGFGGGNAGPSYGGGGAGMGGAIFNRGGTVTIVNSTLTRNTAKGGQASSYYSSGAGGGFGGAVFNLDGSVRLTNDTIDGNTVAAGDGINQRSAGYQVYNLADSLDGKTTATAALSLANTILAGAPEKANDLVNQTIVASPLHNRATVTNVPGIATPTNIIETSPANLDANFNPVSGVSSSVVSVGFIPTNPMLGELKENGGLSQTMVLKPDSPARDGGLRIAAVDAQNNPLLVDQRGATFPRTADGLVDIGAIEMQHITLLDRLGQYIPPNPLEPSKGTGQFMPVTAGTIGADNSTTFDNDVYVIAHGWMNDYLGWVNDKLKEGIAPVSWQTWQGPPPFPKAGPSTFWLYKGGKTTAPEFDINETGLAQSILKADPHATVLAFSWIDESATSSLFAGSHSEAYTTMAGMQMAESLMTALAPNYSTGLGKVHLIGHSHGARVATVAALALQQAAANNPRFDVVRQLTLLDSPEYSQAAWGLLNPVASDEANFDWYNLAQIEMPGRLAAQGTPTNNPTQVIISGANATQLRTGMSMTGPGVPAATTILGINPVTGQPGQVQLNLSAAVKLPSGTSNVGFWNWGPNNDAIFVDSYHSYFGSDYGNFVVKPANQTFKTPALSNVVDVSLHAADVFGDFEFALKHDYAATWYAATATRPIGIFWSPLISNSNLPPARSELNWGSTPKSSEQFALKALDPARQVTPEFTALSIDEKDKQGDVTQPVGPSNAVTLKDDRGNAQYSFIAPPYYETDPIYGFAFNYAFSGPVTDGAQLQIYLNGDLFFAITGSVAESSILPGSGSFSATFGKGYLLAALIYPISGNYVLTDTIQVRLVLPGKDPTGDSTVTVSNFQSFKLPYGPL